MKKFILIILSCILFTQLSFAEESNTFSDIKDDFWAKSAIDYVVSKNIISGYPDGNFKPNKNIKINEFIVMIIKSMGYTVERIDGDDWSSPYIRKALEIGLLYKNQLLYNSLEYTSDLTREEMMRIAMDSISITEGLPYPTISNQYIQYAISDSDMIHRDLLPKVIDGYKLGIMSGYPDGTFKPKKNVTRSEAVSVLVGVLNPKVRKPYSGNPYSGINAASLDVPIEVYLDEEGKNVGFTYIWNREHNSLYMLERNYDDNGNLLVVHGNGSRQYPTQFKYVKMLAPLYKGKPINEVIELTDYLFKNRDNGNGHLEVTADINRVSINASGYKSKEFVESVYEEEKNPTMQTIVQIGRIDFMLGFDPYSSYDNQHLTDDSQPYELIIWKKNQHMGDHKTYSEYFLTTYGVHIKAFINLLFENESDKVWNEFVEGLDYTGDAMVINSTLNNRDYRLLTYYGGISLSISLKKK